MEELRVRAGNEELEVKGNPENCSESCRMICGR